MTPGLPPQFNEPPPPSGGAREALNLPGILFIAFGALSVLLSLASLALTSLTADVNQAQLGPLMDDPNVPAGLKSFLSTMSSRGVQMGSNLLGALVGAVMAFGGVQMRNAKHYGLALVTCVLGMLPCASCCCVTLPIGIWALTILTRPEVKAEFR